MALTVALSACGGTGGVIGTPPAPVATTSAASVVGTVPPSSGATVDSGVTDADVSELESVLDEIEALAADTERLLDEPLP